MTTNDLYYRIALRPPPLPPPPNISVFQVSLPYLGFCPDPKHFIVNCEQNVVKFAEKWGKTY